MVLSCLCRMLLVAANGVEVPTSLSSSMSCCVAAGPCRVRRRQEVISLPCMLAALVIQIVALLHRSSVRDAKRDPSSLIQQADGELEAAGGVALSPVS